MGGGGSLLSQQINEEFWVLLLGTACFSPDNNEYDYDIRREIADLLISASLK